MMPRFRAHRSGKRLRGKISGTYEGLFPALTCSRYTLAWWSSGAWYLQTRKHGRWRYSASPFISFLHFCRCTLPFRTSEARGNPFFELWSCSRRTGTHYMRSTLKISSRWRISSKNMRTSPPLWCSSGPTYLSTFVASRPISVRGACASLSQFFKWLACELVRRKGS